MCHVAIKWLLVTWPVKLIVPVSVMLPAIISNRRLISHVPRAVEDATYKRYPYVVCIMYEVSRNNSTNEAKHCSGSLITSQWLITAAHCVIPTIKLRVKCDNISIPWNESRCKANVLKQISHPSYIGRKNDIALMLVEEIILKKYGQLHSADYKTFIGRVVKYAGHGLKISKFPDKNVSEKLHIPLGIEEGVVFNDDMKVKDMIPRILVGLKCSDRSSKKSLKVDSGGPVFVEGRIAGVSLPVYPDPFGAYCPVSPYINWIMENVAS